MTQAARENACSSKDILIIIRISLFADIIKDVLPGLERNRDISRNRDKTFNSCAIEMSFTR